MTAVWYYVLPMLLGRTYDMKTDLPGIDVFPQSEIDKAGVIQRHMTDSQYRIIDNQLEARDFLDVTGELSLKLKTGRVSLQGLGNYLKESQSRADSVEILVKVRYETVTYTLPSTARPREGWKTLDKVNVGTHYVRSITYGGEMVASLKFVAKQEADRSKIKAAVQANLQADTGSFGLGIAGNFSQLQDDLQDMSSLEISYFATVPIKGIPNTMESLVELVEEFPEQTQLVNKGLGVPIRMELFPLTALDADIPLYVETRALTDQLDLLEAQFDDVRSTMGKLREWLVAVPPVLPKNILDEIGEFNDNLEHISAVFYNVLGNLNLEADALSEQFVPAFDAYKGTDGSLPDKYHRKFLILKQKILRETPDLKMDVGGTSYTRWGHNKCDSQGSSKMFHGIISSTDRLKSGSSEIICLTENPEWDSKTEAIKRNPRHYSRLSPVLLRGRPTQADRRVACAECFVEERTTARTFEGHTTCPAGWTLEYEGFLMSKEFRSKKGSFICVDTKSVNTAKTVLVTPPNHAFGYMADVVVSCGTLPCGPYKKDSLIPCVVCSF